MSHLQYFDYEGFGQRVRKDMHYSQAVRHGDTIEISGQGGWDRITEEIPTDPAKEMDQAFDNVEHTLQKAGGKGWEQVYKLTVYVDPVDPKAVERLIYNLRKYCPNHQPLVSLFGVAALGLPGMHVEIVVEAHLGQ